MNWSLELTHPYRLFALVTLLVIAWGYRRSLLDFSRRQRLVSTLIRCVIIVLLVFSLAGLTLLHPTSDKMLVFLVDQSRSVDADADQVARDFIEQTQELAGQSPTVFIPFASRPEKSVTSLAPAPEPSASALSEGSEAAAITNDPEVGPLFSAEAFTPEESWDEATDIAAAFEPAFASVPPCYVPYFVLISDGNETSGDALASAIRAGVPISTIPLPASEAPEVQLAEVRIPANVPAG